MRKISPTPQTGFDPRTVQPVASRYTDYATRPTYRVVHSFYRGSLYFQNITRFHRTHLDVILFASLKHVRPSISIFMKLTNIQHDYLQISFVELHPNRTRCVEYREEISLRSTVMYVFHCANFIQTHSHTCGPGSSVGIATGLRSGRSGDRIPVGARFFAPAQTGPGSHPASCTMGTGSFPGVKSDRGVTLTPHLF